MKKRVAIMLVMTLFLLSGCLTIRGGLEYTSDRGNTYGVYSDGKNLDVSARFNSKNPKPLRRE